MQFTRVARTVKGYHVDDVDEWFQHARAAYERGGSALTATEVRTAAFRLRRGGYEVAEVDAALDRLEDAVAGRERARLVGVGGEDALVSVLTRQAMTLQSRLDRPWGERFARCDRTWEKGYDPDEVDDLCDRLQAYFSDGVEMSADEVRRAVFRTRYGSRGYREPEVDAFLDRAVQIMVAVD